MADCNVKNKEVILMEEKRVYRCKECGNKKMIVSPSNKGIICCGGIMNKVNFAKKEKVLSK